MKWRSHMILSKSFARKKKRMRLKHMHKAFFFQSGLWICRLPVILLHTIQQCLHSDPWSLLSSNNFSSEFYTTYTTYIHHRRHIMGNTTCGGELNLKASQFSVIKTAQFVNVMYECPKGWRLCTSLSHRRHKRDLAAAWRRRRQTYVVCSIARHLDSCYLWLV